MSLLLRPFLLIAALGQAAWLRFRGEPGPNLGSAEHWKGRFRLAVWLAMATLPSSGQDPLPPTIMCYDMAPTAPDLELPLSRVRLLWIALDPAKGPELEAALASAARFGDVEVPVAKLLLRVHRVLADHRDRTRVQHIMCYKMSEATARQMNHRETALAQLEALAKVRAAGQVAPDVMKNAESVLRAELRQLGLKPPPVEKDIEGVARILTDWYTE